MRNTIVWACTLLLMVVLFGCATQQWVVGEGQMVTPSRYRSVMQLVVVDADTGHALEGQVTVISSPSPRLQQRMHRMQEPWGQRIAPVGPDGRASVTVTTDEAYVHVVIQRPGYCTLLYDARVAHQSSHVLGMRRC